MAVSVKALSPFQNKTFTFWLGSLISENSGGCAVACNLE